MKILKVLWNDIVKQWKDETNRETAMAVGVIFYITLMLMSMSVFIISLIYNKFLPDTFFFSLVWIVQVFILVAIWVKSAHKRVKK